MHEPHHEWIEGHWEWHGVACYVVVPLEGEPTLVYGMGGTHIEAVRQATAGAIGDVRHSRGGRFGEVMVERINDVYRQLCAKRLPARLTG